MKTINISAQRGYVGFVLLVFLLPVSVISAVSYNGFGSKLRIDTDVRMQRLQRARNALLEHVLSYHENYSPRGAGLGHFPCPDRDPPDDNSIANDGPNPPCARAGTQLGLFPRSVLVENSLLLGADHKRVLLDSGIVHSSDRLWYHVSASHINNPVSTVVNDLTVGELNVDGTDDIVAVLIAGGPPLLHQRGVLAGVHDSLEGENADGDGVYTSRRSAENNDRLVYISGHELRVAMRDRIIVKVAQWLQSFSNQHCVAGQSCFPWPSSPESCRAELQTGLLPLSQLPCEHNLAIEGSLEGVALAEHWFVRNRWHRRVLYRIDAACADGSTAICTVDARPETAAAGGRLLMHVRVVS
jgi:hypothetical protein